MSKDLQVIGITKKMLRDAVAKNSYWNGNLTPLPKSKALWLLSNSRIEEKDYCGVIGYEGEKMISFIFMFPDLLNNKDLEPTKVYWMISWWVDKQFKNTVLGTYIYNEAVNLTGKQILIKSYAENVNSFYEKQPFTVIVSRLRHTIFFSLDASMLIGKFKFLKKFKFILDKIDATTAAIIRLLNKPKAKNKTRELSYEYINQLEDITWDFIEPLCKNDLIYKTKDYVNWQLYNMQYTQTPISKKHPYKSLQTGTSNNIYIHNLKIMKQDTIIGFLSYVINYNELNIKYFLVGEESNYNLCVDALIENLIQKKAKFIFTDDTKLSDTITKRYKTIFTHRVTKKGLAHKETKLGSEKLEMLNRDGHFY
ncbi:hypothetical protein [Aquimarina muelleri]|uniref:Uncharacterized protein n=1 Tax=Aquimarina muelleri TaxID=279356 RepID=A0A918JX41_9FLAO|nr:hypothetical protein [Aquimarina muelleri]MCX2762880.1 hypothetical protein [Aquimarina muelleri]GGX27033.1 hypothetical protein GCM10007384_30320 [Aquimarina muelleri]